MAVCYLTYCVKCGRPADGGFVKRKLRWSPLQKSLSQWIALPLFLLGGIWAIDAFFAGNYLSAERAEIYVPLCEKHADNYDTLRTFGWFLMIGGAIVVIVLTVVMAPKWDIWLAGLLAFVGALCRNQSQLILRPTFIDR